ncbi:ABC transporter substrate-binding protein [Streptomyces sp. TE5632]
MAGHLVRAGTVAGRGRRRARAPCPCGALGPWAAEAYGAVRFAAHGLAATGGDGRSALRAELLRRPWQGITRRVAFDPDGHFFEPNDDGGAFLYRVTGGSARFVARWDDIGEEAGGET